MVHAAVFVESQIEARAKKHAILANFSSLFCFLNQQTNMPFQLWHAKPLAFLNTYLCVIEHNVRTQELHVIISSTQFVPQEGCKSILPPLILEIDIAEAKFDNTKENSLYGTIF